MGPVDAPVSASANEELSRLEQGEYFEQANFGDADLFKDEVPYRIHADMRCYLIAPDFVLPSPSRRTSAGWIALRHLRPTADALRRRA